MFSTHRNVRSGYPIADYDGREAYRVEEVAELITATVYAACVWTGGVRREWGFLVASWCVLDFDEGVTKREAQEALEGYRYVLAPTKSDGVEKLSSSGKAKPACDRFRVLVPFAAPIWNLDVFRYNMKRWIAHFGSDPLPYDGGRIWQPSPRVECISRDGRALDVCLNIPVEETQAFKQEKSRKLTEAMVASGRLPPRVKAFIEGRVSPGSRNDELFKCAAILFNFGWTVEKVKRLVLSIPEMADHDKIDSTLKSAAKKTGAAYF